MIWDTFLFFNELDLLDLRLNVHGPFVDRFVLVESTRDFRGRPKPLYYRENSSLFGQFKSRIEHIIIDNREWEGRDPWLNEAEQRNAIKFGLNDAKDDDIIHVSDADEIIEFPMWDSIGGNCFKLLMRSFMYYLNLEQKGEVWKSSNAMRMSKLKNDGDLNQIRLKDDNPRSTVFCGWHFTYMGGPDRVKQKLQSFSHSEFDKPMYTDQSSISHRIKNRINVTGNLGQLNLEKILITEATHPKFLVENQERYKHLILQ